MVMTVAVIMGVVMTVSVTVFVGVTAMGMRVRMSSGTRMNMRRFMRMLMSCRSVFVVVSRQVNIKLNPGDSPFLRAREMKVVAS